MGRSRDVVAPNEPSSDYRPWPDCQAVQATMAKVLRSRLNGWDSIDPADVRVEHVGRTGGGRVFKLTNQARTPSAAAALRVLPDRWSGAFREVFVAKTRAAQRAFSDADLAMGRLAEDPGGEWLVEGWGGDVIHDQELSVAVVERIGRSLARAHAINPAWFNATRQALSELYPVLAHVDDGGWLWAWVWYSGLDQMSEPAQRRHAVIGPAPASEAGGRLVTCHLDPSGENIVRGPDDRWRFIDFDSASVNHAALDIAVFFSKPYCHRPVFKEALVRGYLQELGGGATEEDVFALRLDAERMLAHPLRIGLGELSHPLADRIVAIANRALVDPDLARDILANGFRGCAPMLALSDTLVAPYGLPRPVPAAIHRDAPEQAFRTELRVNWDGTIAVPARKGLLGEGADGRVVVRHVAQEGPLRVSLRGGTVPITGLRAPVSPPVPLLLAGAHAGRAVVAGEVERDPVERAVGFLEIGSSDDALTVHFEPDGAIRLADRLHLQLSHYGGRTRPGTRIVIAPAIRHGSQRFRVHDDATISPDLHRDSVFGVNDFGLVLVAARAESGVLEFDEVVTARAPTPSDRGASTRQPSTRVTLELASHPGMALSAEPWPGRQDVLRPVIVPVSEASPWVVDSDGLRLADGGGVLAVGLPLPTTS